MNNSLIMINNIAHLIFMLIMAVVFFGSHYFFYFSIIKFFAIANTSTRLYLFFTITFLSLSLIITSLLAHYFNNSFTRYAYIASGIWLGTFVNFLLAISFVWICVGLAKYFNFNFQPNNLFIFLSIVVVIVSFFGIRSAYNPQVKKIKVEIKNLPENWKGKHIVQISDVHLGHVYQIKFLKKVVGKINDLHPEAVFITGDLFDGMDGRLDSLVLPLNDINSEKGTYFVTGNHETYLGLSEAFGVLAKTNINVLNDKVVDIDGLKIIGISYPEKFIGDDEIKKLESLQLEFNGSPNILLYHAPINISEAKKAGVNLQLSGHTHLGQQLPFGLITRIIYGDYAYGLHAMGDYSIYTSSGLGTWGISMRIGTTAEIVDIELN